MIDQFYITCPCCNKILELQLESGREEPIYDQIVVSIAETNEL
jgi:hypothetical protein